MASSDPKRNETRSDLVDEIKSKHGAGAASIVERYIDGEITEKPRRYYEPTEDR